MKRVAKVIALVALLVGLIGGGAGLRLYANFFLNDVTIANFDAREVCVWISGNDTPIRAVPHSWTRRTFRVPPEGVLAWQYCDSAEPARELVYVASGIRQDHLIIIREGEGEHLSAFPD
ncbi:hypothetical protein [Maricaulis alexandrii]|uniref:hypothetical protein n=1 Tax=Maricaulis alexandrii TaxID=2570354 RepID=UPI001108D349|nr:hypothetical protein [Maricaulis alexandrii]